MDPGTFGNSPAAINLADILGSISPQEASRFSKKVHGALKVFKAIEAIPDPSVRKELALLYHEKTKATMPWYMVNKKARSHALTVIATRYKQVIHQDEKNSITDKQVVSAYLLAGAEHEKARDAQQAFMRRHGTCDYLYGLDVKEPTWPYDILERETGQPFKVCYRAMERACERDLIEYGVSLRAGWVTEKGMKLINKP